MDILKLKEDNFDSHDSKIYFPVEGFYGGFSYELSFTPDDKLKLTVESWRRIEDGSGQRHEITENGCVLVEEGFV